MLFLVPAHSDQKDVCPQRRVALSPFGLNLSLHRFGGILFGYLADRFGRKTVLSWTILIYSLGSFACGFAGSAWWLLVFRVITGLGVGGEWATGQTLVSESFPARMRARYAAVMQTGVLSGSPWLL